MAEYLKKYNSKVLLFGEYTVTIGSDALAVPFEGFSGHWQFSKSNTHDNLGLYSLLSYLSATEKVSKTYNIFAFEDDLEKGLFFDSTIPTGYGLGSSGALVAAFYDRYAKQKTNEVTVLKEIMAQTESAFHGTSSGIDPLVSYFNKPLLIDSDGQMTVPELQLKDFKIFLLDTGISRSTAPLVQQFRSKMQTSPAFKNAAETLILYNKQAIQAILNGNGSNLQSIWYEISRTQYDNFGDMIPESCRELWAEGLQSHKYFIKLCGAGGGGMLLGLWIDDDKAELSTRFSPSFFLHP